MTRGTAGPMAEADTGAAAEAGAPAEGDAPPAGELAERLAAAATACEGVVGLSADGLPGVMTYRRGVPVRGVAVRDDQVVVCVIATLDRPLTETAGAVATTVAPLAGGRPVHVIVGDVVADGSHEGGEDDA